MIQTLNETFTAAVPKRVRMAFRFFRLLSAPSPVNVRWGRGGRLENYAESMDAGFWFRSLAGQGDFDILQIENPSTQAVKFLLSDDDAGFDRAFGTVSVDAIGGLVHTMTKITATNASAQALAANAVRKYFAVQVPAAAVAGVKVRTDGGVAADDATSFEVLPGETWEPAVVPVGQINVIRQGAANIDFLVIES